MNRGDFFAFFRRIGILYYLDFVRFFIQKIARKKSNDAFRKNNPDVKLPPDYLIYESFHLNYENYYFDGRETATWLLGILEKHKILKNIKILDWGCGPGRIVRHLPNIVDQSNQIYGSDYNQQSINWCSKNIPNVEFRVNKINPPLFFDDNYFDIIYGISIFTHLSEKSHHDWIQELLRVIKTDGIMLFSTHGDAFKNALSRSELIKYNKGELIIRGKVKEGHKIYGAFHPPSFMRNFFKTYAQIIEHIPGKEAPGSSKHDIWVLKKLN
ncbi:MAG: class I SAM-dependent methyltransferase [Saprospiraceae bacterium]|nr:class I SAM-dependent methyltransferase [Saprospiraceae bacterium]